MSELHGATVQGAPRQVARRTKAVAASVLGSMMEWYDFVTFAYVATYISRAFFPSSNETTALLATFATFGAGYLTRPLGGILFGMLGDTKGRKYVLTVTMVLMAVATISISLLPGFDQMGYLAPIGLLVARLGQGLSAGGEGTTGMIYAVEWAPHGRRGLFGSFQVSGSGTGLLLGSATVSVLLATLSPEAMASWGWRVPFLVGGVIIGPIGFWIRRSMEESPAFSASSARHQKKESAFTRSQVASGVRLFLLNSSWSIIYYVFLSFMPTFAQRVLHISATHALAINTLSLAVYIVSMPFFGFLSDKVGRRPVLLASTIGFALLTYPLFNLLVSNKSISLYIPVVCCFAVLLAMYSGTAVSTFSELFPTKSRARWFSGMYQLSAAVFGGFTPYVATWLIKTFNSPLAPTAYIITGSIVGAITIWTMKETAKVELR
ncbi:MFS transporter [Paraburkholderia sp. EG285A]|uniref:MFS transporter n=1 Tax=Paraburkholderia sp. EG285A TaxID=3237009 RepID=UPI0034D260EE